jgi:hypothetical protein
LSADEPHTTHHHTSERLCYIDADKFPAITMKDENDPEKIYYHLSDGQNSIGSVDRIELSSSELSRRDVGNLRKMIKAEHNRLLKDFDPGDLSLYAKGTTIDDYHDQNPLEIDLPLSDDQIQETSTRKPLLVVLAPTALPASTANIQQQTSLDRFRKYLHDANIPQIDEKVISVIVSKFASSVQLVDSADRAKEIYFEACLLPRSATQILLQKHNNISVADMYRASDPSKAVLLHAHENGAPRILKIGTKENLVQELEVWDAVK